MGAMCRSEVLPGQWCDGASGMMVAFLFTSSGGNDWKPLKFYMLRQDGKFVETKPF